MGVYNKEMTDDEYRVGYCYEKAVRVHELKIEKDYADSVYFGDKNFEVRNNDRGFQKGDEIVFHVVKSGYSSFFNTEHPLHNARYEITYVLGSFYGLKDGFVAFGIKPIEITEVGAGQ